LNPFSHVQEQTVRRFHALVAIHAFVATAVTALLLSLVVSPGSAAVGPDTLTIVSSNASPYPPYTGSYEDGQQLMILLNIDEGDNDVYSASLETDKSGSYQPVTGQTGKTTNSYGRYVFTYAPTGVQNVRATWVENGVTRYSDVLHLTPQVPVPVAPTGPDVGDLLESPTTFAAGDSITLTANFPSGTFPITLYKETAPDVWTSIGTKTSNSSGDSTFTGFAVTSATQRVFARKANNDRTEIDVIAPSPTASLHILRDCTANNCADTATANVATTPVQQGRVFKLQYKSGSSWVAVTGSTPAPTGSDGKVQIPFSLTGVPQWTARTYRVTSDADASNPALTSPDDSFMPGPTQLGRNVLRVDVDKGVFPTSKSSEYTGKATLSTDGNVFLNHVALEKFGVRGTSTATYTKKPYKLKFDKSPKNTTVFGMGADKSWTLLASYLDQSFVRDKVGLDLGRAIAGPIPWTPDSRFVELFVNDQYRGSYLMTESVKIDGDRVTVDPATGMIMEVDNAVGSSSTGFTSSKGVPIVFKDPDERKTLADGSVDPEGVTTEKLNAIKARVNLFESKLYSSTTRAQYQDYLDEASAVDFQFIKEFTKDNDADFNSSHYFSWDQTIDSTDPLNPLQDGRFHFGPAWDFDRSAGNVDPDTAGHTYMTSPIGWVLRGTGTPSDSGRQLYKTHWFVQLFKDAGFNTAVKARWLVIRDKFKAVGDTDVAQLKTDIGVGADNDRHRWASEPKRYKVHSAGGLTGYDGEIAYVTKWYKDRYTWMNGQLTAP
jgi:hypothetical protein